MKKTTRTNISGRIFNIDEDAFDLLDRYLTSIDSYFSYSNEGAEILNDIEHRIASHFQKITMKSIEVISIKDVHNVIDIIGHPDNFDINWQEHSRTNILEDNFTKRLYRDKKHAYIGGVAAGIANYLKVDALIVRILFILLAFLGGGSAIIYLILWILIPKAKTTIEKLEMRGQKVNINNIQQAVIV